MMEVAYGHDVTSLDDEIVVLAEKAVGAATEAGSPAATLIDFLPFCAYYSLNYRRAIAHSNKCNGSLHGCLEAAGRPTQPQFEGWCIERVTCRMGV